MTVRDVSSMAKNTEFIALRPADSGLSAAHVGADSLYGAYQGSIDMMMTYGDLEAHIFEWSPNGDEDSYVLCAKIKIEELL